MGYIPPTSPGEFEPRWLTFAEVARLIITFLMLPALALAAVGWGIMRMAS